MTLVIVVVNYGTPALTLACIASLQAEVVPGQDLVVVVDNASPDDSVAQIERAIGLHRWEAWVRLLRSPGNGGFAYGNNLAIKAYPADAYLLLNSDAQVLPGAVQALKGLLDRRPDVGIASPHLQDPAGAPLVNCCRYQSPASEFLAAARTGILTRLLKAYDVPLHVYHVMMEVDWTSLACAMLRSQLLEQVGLLDEGYFMYFEDMDYCRRARLAGWRIVYLPAARVVHLEGGSSGGPDAPGRKIANRTARRRPRYYYASRARYFARFYGRGGLWLANLLWWLGRTVSFARELSRNKQRHTHLVEEWDIWTGWRDPLPS